MTIPFGDRIQESTTTTGTANIVLGGTSSTYKTFASKYVAGDYFYYAIVSSAADEWETGQGQLVNSTSFSRSVIMESTNSNAIVSLSAGTKTVFIDLPAVMVGRYYTKGRSGAARMGGEMP